MPTERRWPGRWRWTPLASISVTDPLIVPSGTRRPARTSVSGGSHLESGRHRPRLRREPCVQTTQHYVSLASQSSHNGQRMTVPPGEDKRKRPRHPADPPPNPPVTTTAALEPGLGLGSVMSPITTTSDVVRAWCCGPRGWRRGFFTTPHIAVLRERPAAGDTGIPKSARSRGVQDQVDPAARRQVGAISRRRWPLHAALPLPPRRTPLGGSGAPGLGHKPAASSGPPAAASFAPRGPNGAMNPALVVRAARRDRSGHSRGRRSTATTSGTMFRWRTNSAHAPTLPGCWTRSRRRPWPPRRTSVGRRTSRAETNLSTAKHEPVWPTSRLGVAIEVVTNTPRPQLPDLQAFLCPPRVEFSAPLSGS